MRHRFVADAMFVTLAALGAAGLAHCAGDRSHSPTCGLAMIAGPTLIQQQLTNAPFVLLDAPRGLPGKLPARVAGQPQQGNVLVAYSGHQLVMGYQGTAFPVAPGGYGLLVVDDSTARAEGVWIYESDVPKGFPELGTLTGTDRSIPVFGVRVDWRSVSNPRCPLLGSPPAPGSATP